MDVRFTGLQHVILFWDVRNFTVFNALSCATECSVQSQEAIRESEQSSALIEQLEAQLEEAQRQEAATKAVLDAQRSAGRSGEILSNREIREITQSVLNPEAAEPSSQRGAAGGGGILSGLFGGATKAAAQSAEEEVCFWLHCFKCHAK
jgi:hypothetical protein